MILEQASALWAEYYPVILTGITTIGAFLGILYGVYTQVKPLIEKIQDLKDKVSNIEPDDISNELSNIDLNTKILDLQAKIESPAISDALTAQYQTQLDQLMAIKEKIESGVVKIEEVTSKF